jgi:curved DNA-binding protein CbpA
MTDDPYEILRIKPGATERELRRAFRKRARELHPDRNPGDKKAEARFKQLSAAYRAVRDNKVPLLVTRAPGDSLASEFSAAGAYAFVRAQPTELGRRKKLFIGFAFLALVVLWVLGLLLWVQPSA